MNSAPKLCFKNLKGFQIIDNEKKIETETFLAAAEEIVQIIETFGTLFIPVSSDMRGNIKKIKIVYEIDTQTFCYIDHIASIDSKSVHYHSIDALKWLKRALNLIFIFFKNILEDPNTSENLKDHLKDAYEKTLKQHHGIIVKQTVTFIYRWVPKRSDLLGVGDLYDENIKSLSELMKIMEANLNRINFLLNDFPNKI